MASVLDSFGNVVGGLRSPYLDMPTSRRSANLAGRRSASSPATRCRSPRRSSQLYGRHGAYVRRIVKDTARLVARRYITAYDGLDLIREAAQANVP